MEAKLLNEINKKLDLIIEYLKINEYLKNNEPATDKQLNYIAKLTSKNYLNKILERKQLSKKQASKLIDYLLTKKSKKNENGNN